jgi:hypothetical protein
VFTSHYYSKSQYYNKGNADKSFEDVEELKDLVRTVRNRNYIHDIFKEKQTQKYLLLFMQKPLFFSYRKLQKCTPLFGYTRFPNTQSLSEFITNLL